MPRSPPPLGGRINIFKAKRGARPALYGPNATTHPKLVKAVVAAGLQETQCQKQNCEDAIRKVDRTSTDVSDLLEVLNALNNHGGGLNGYIDELSTWCTATLASLSRACASLNELLQQLEEERGSVMAKLQMTNFAIEVLKKEAMLPSLPDWTPQEVIERVQRVSDSLKQLLAVEPFTVGPVKDPQDPFQKRTVRTTVMWKFGSGAAIPCAWAGTKM